MLVRGCGDLWGNAIGSFPIAEISCSVLPIVSLFGCIVHCYKCCSILLLKPIMLRS